MNPISARSKFDMANDMASPAHRPSASGRKGSKKVRTGCITCKIRKVKCDETKPYCLRCTKTGRKCDGYLDPTTIASRRRSKEHVPLSVLLEWASPEEKRSFHFFQHVTAPSLSGDLDGVFWRVLVLQICQREPAVRHAVLAVSSLHEGLIQGVITPYADEAGPKQSFALQQYNKAIACLLDQMNDPTGKPMGPLLTCILFVCIEFMQSKDKESLIHLEQGRQILSRLERRATSRDPEIEVIKQHLVPMYTRLSMTSFLFGGTPVPIPESLKTIKDIPVMFESLHEMRYTLHDFLDRILRFTQRSRPAKYNSSVPTEVMVGFENEQQRLLKELAKLNVAFSLYQAAKPREASQTTAAVLQIYLHIGKIWLSTALSMHETTFDDHLPSFSAIVPLAAAILNAESFSPLHTYPNRAPTSIQHSPGLASPPRDSVLQSPAVFSFETHVIPALYYVATKCRHPLVRHAALDLLKRNPSKRENLWRADVIGGIASHVVKVEERWIQRGTSPSDVYSASLFPTQSSPEELWAARLPSLSNPDDFRMGDFSRSLAASGVPEVSLAPLTSGIQAETTSAPLLVPEELDLDIDMPIDPALLMEVEVASAHSFSGAASHTSYDDRLGGDAMLLDPTSITVKYFSGSASSIHGSSMPPTPRDDGLATPHRRHSGSLFSDSSSPFERNHDLSTFQPRQSTEAPFDLPEHLRIHDAIIGPEKEDGTWVTVFRKLHGLEEDWDVQTEYVNAL